MSSKVVIRGANGRLNKGYTEDFAPNKPFLHLTPPQNHSKPEVVHLKDLKAVFFVKDFNGQAWRIDAEGFKDRQIGKEIFVEFKDGEKMWGYSNNYQAEAQGFFLFPADRNCNNEKVYIYNTAVEYVLYS